MLFIAVYKQEHIKTNQQHCTGSNLEREEEQQYY
jgi:hypothetical protein